MMSIRLVIFLPVSLIIFSACGGGKKEDASAKAPAKPQVMKVDGYVVKTEPFAEKIEVPGTIVANEATEIRPEVSGRIVQLNIKEGKLVTKGSLLAKLYDADLQAELRKLQVQLQIANTNENRSSQLLKIQGISKADYDNSLLNVNNIKADIDIIRTNISRTEIRAPFNGKIGLKSISPGAYVTPTTVIAVINQVSQLKMDFTVPEKYTTQIKNGQIVNFSYEGSNESFKAKVVATESSVTETTRSLIVRSLILDKNDQLLPGSFAKVQLNFEPTPDAILVPTQAILPQARGKKIVVARDGVAKFIEVTTGVRDSARVQVTSGLKAGDTIITTGLLSLRPDGKIQVSRVINAARQPSK